MNLEEHDLLLDTIQSDGMKLVFREAQLLLSDFEKKVLLYDLDTGSDRTLALLKAQAEGAAKFLKKCSMRFESIRVAASNANKRK